MLGVFREDAMHPEADALLDAIWESPGDDTPRLVYADWLQEHGYETYAAYIRICVEIARRDRPPAEHTRLRQQRHALGRELMSAHRSAAELIDRTNPPDGIPREQHIEDASRFLSEWREWWPFVWPRSLTLREVSGFEGAVASCPYLRRLVALECEGLAVAGEGHRREDVEWEPVGGDLLLQLPLRDDRWHDIGKLAALRVTPIRATPAQLLTFADSPLAGQLEELRLWVQFPDGSREDLRGEKRFVSHHIRDFVATNAARFATQTV
jgi:uncharacterized protein (TIGR02996 family)